MRYDQRLAALLAAVMILSVVALPGIAVAGDDGEVDGLEIDVTQNGEVLIEVTEGNDSVEGASVNVTATNESNSTHTFEVKTNESGQHNLGIPNETVHLEFEVTYNGETATAEKKVEPVEADDEHDLRLEINQSDGVHVTVLDNDSAVENATVNVATVDENASYADTGNHTTDENGLVSLSEPVETVDVTVTATVDDDIVETTETLESAYEEQPNFGGMVSLFVSNNLGSTDDPFGLSVASFVLEHNPGNAPAHAGPSGDQGPPDHAGNSDEDDDGQGPPAHAGPSDDDNGQGPPAHAGPSDDGDDGEGDDAEESDGDDAGE